MRKISFEKKKEIIDRDFAASTRCVFSAIPEERDRILRSIFMQMQEKYGEVGAQFWLLSHEAAGGDVPKDIKNYSVLF